MTMPKLAGSLLALTLSMVACGDGDATCAPGTALQNGQCVSVGVDVPTGGNDTSNSGGSDTTINRDTNSGGTDTATGSDTTTAPDVSGECAPEEAGARDFGAACSKNCQCRTDLGGFCYNGPFLEGFSFCSREGGAAGLIDADVYPTLLWNSACWSFPSSQWVRPITKTCSTLEDCKLLSDAYTHCGTQGFSWHTGGNNGGTQCPDRDGFSSTQMSGKRVCIIDTLPPFNRRP